MLKVSEDIWIDISKAEVIAGSIVIINGKEYETNVSPSTLFQMWNNTKHTHKDLAY